MYKYIMYKYIIGALFTLGVIMAQYNYDTLPNEDIAIMVIAWPVTLGNITGQKWLTIDQDTTLLKQEAEKN